MNRSYTYQQAIAGSGVYMEAFVSCWQCNVQHSFGLDPTAAAARIQGEIKGDLFFAQTLAKQGECIKCGKRVTMIHGL